MPDKRVIDDKIYCETIAKSISDIIRFSLKDEFRKSCCELFGVFSTAQTEKEISMRLMSIIENTGTRSKKKGKKSCKEKDKENIEERNDISDEEKADQSTNTVECESQTLSENTPQSWLQISSQQYRAMIKRKKLRFRSQPPYVQQKDVDVSDLHFSNSQPTSKVSSSSSLNEAMKDSLEVSDDGVNFCKKRFKESFEENARKYFKNNLKYTGSSS